MRRPLMKWLLAQGDSHGSPSRTSGKAGKLYTEIERTASTGHGAQRVPLADERQRRLVTEDLEKQSSKESTAAGLRRTQGSPVGRWDARLDYNAFPEEGVDALVSFMREFEGPRIM